MAAHDTLTSSLTSFVGELAAHPEWQAGCATRSTRSASRRRADTLDKLEAMPLTEMAFKEAMRLKPPVPSMPRRAMRDFTFKGYAIPAGTLVGVNPLFTHHMPEIWPEPERFDPMRFTDEAQRNRHRFAWVPFGGGAHMCLGLHFAYMQAKCFARHFLQNLSVSLEPGYTAAVADVADPEAARWAEVTVPERREPRGKTVRSALRKSHPGACPRLIERLAQRDIALLLRGPVAAAGDGAVDHQIVAVDEARLVAG